MAIKLGLNVMTKIDIKFVDTPEDEKLHAAVPIASDTIPLNQSKNAALEGGVLQQVTPDIHMYVDVDSMPR
ncbi:Killer toxin subunits alpha/beta [Apiospora phragmitis]|uniref:Killer toxin subunits alpha/beta n=1 Tax=Apiospora phragmitis TaxID=2905665 RepID=A0ABR1TUM5_9PEZI